MPENLETLYILLILLPGFVTLIIERGIAFQEESSSLMIIIKSLIYSFIIYVLISIFSNPIEIIREEVNDKFIYKIDDNSWVYLTASVILGLLIGLLKTKDWLMCLLRKVGLTKRTARGSLWLDVFHEKYSHSKDFKERREIVGAYLVIEMKDGRRVYGWPEYFSDDFNEGPVLFLTRAC